MRNISRSFQTVIYLSVASLLSVGVVGCQEAPGVGKAAQPSQAESRGPVMGSAATNKDVTRKVQVMEAILDGKLTIAQAAEKLDEEFKALDEKEKAERLQVMNETLKELPGDIGKGGVMPKGPDRDMIMGRLYFGEHRFIEAATLFSKILDVKDDYPQARNMLARCFYFLGNPDRTVDELLFILKHPRQGRDTSERYDALFLLGAAVVENKSPSKEKIKIGIWAWENYLKEIPDSERAGDVKSGLQRLRAMERGETVQPEPGGPNGSAAPTGPSMASQLPADATPFERSRAEGLDALNAKNLALAEAKLLEALDTTEDAAAFVGLARVFVQTGRYPEALATFQKSIDKDASYMPAYHYKGMAHMMSGDPKGAVSNWEYVLKTDPNYAKEYKLDQRINVAKRMALGN